MRIEAPRGMTQVIANRNITLRSTSGHTIFFRKNQPKNVPNILVEECVHRGILPMDKDDLPGSQENPLLPDIPRGSIRLQQMRDAIDALIQRNSRGDFAASGQPNLKSIEGIVGYPVDVTEVQRVWHVMQMDKAESRNDARDEVKSDAPIKPDDPEELHKAVLEACESVMANGHEEDYTASGAPQVRSIENRLGYQISAADRDMAYTKLERKQVVR